MEQTNKPIPDDSQCTEEEKIQFHSDMEAVKQYGLALKNVKKQTPEICLAAVKKDGDALEYVKEQTPEICLAAIKKNGYALEYVKEQTPEICLEAVKKICYALKYVKEQTAEICLEAVKRDGYTIDYVKEQTLEICMEAVKEDGLALEYIKEKTPEICLEAVKQNGLALKYVKEQTEEICLEAIKQISIENKQIPEFCLATIKENIDEIDCADLEMFSLIIQSNKKLKQKLVYEDIVANTHNFIENADTILNAIAKYIEIKHGYESAKKLINAYENPSLIDDKYIGFYVKKQNDYVYELHSRELQKKNNGWIMNNYVDVFSDTLVGKFIIPQ